MANGWRVTGQRGTEDLINGRLAPVMEINVETTNGTTVQFRVPTAQYTADGVKALVDEWYERHQAVVGL